MARNFSKVRSVGFARETAHGTENTTDNEFTYVRAEVGIPTRPREIEDLDYASGDFGAMIAPHVNDKAGGEITLKFALPGFKVGYDASSEAPGTTSNVIDPLIALIGNCLGSDGASAVSSAANFRDGTHLYTRGYVSGDVASAPGGAVVGVTTGASYNEGEFFAAQTNEDGDAPCIGWVLNVDTTPPTPDEITLRETPENQPVVSDDVLGCIVAYLANVERVPFSMRIMGDNAAFKQSFVGCAHKSLKLIAHNKKMAIVEMVLRYSSRGDFSSGGGLQAVTQFQRIAPLIGDQGGYFIYGTAGSGAATCGWHELELELDWSDSLAVVECLGSTGGESEVNLGQPAMKLTAKVPESSSDAKTNNTNPFELALEQGTAKAVTAIIGTQPGSIFSFTLPAMHLAAAVEKEVLPGGIEAYSLEWRPGAYSGDTGTTAPANAKVAFGWA